MTDPATIKNRRRDLAKQADAILKGARFDAMTGAKKDRAYRLNKRAENKRRGPRSSARSKKNLGHSVPLRQ